MSDYDFSVTGFEFKGFKDLYKALDGLSEATTSKELAPMLLEAVEPVRSTAEAIAPDDLKTPNPDLESTIVASTRQRSGRAKRDRKLGRFDARVFVGPSGNSYRGRAHAAYPQAIMQEFGTVDHVAQPFMRPAWDAQKQNVLNILKALFRSHIFAVAKKYGKV